LFCVPEQNAKAGMMPLILGLVCSFLAGMT
jgi:hypothetical protein